MKTQPQNHRAIFGRPLTIFIFILLSSNSYGHGAYPAVVGIVETEPLVIKSTFGIWLPQENDRYHLFCEELYQGSITPEAIRDEQGSIYVGLFKGVLRIDSNTCAVEQLKVDGQDLYVRSFVHGPDNKILLVTSSGGKDNGIFRGENGNKTWTREGPEQTDLYFTSIKDAGSGQFMALGFRIDPETDERTAFMCSREETMQWQCKQLEEHGPPEREQPILDDCKKGRGCLLHWQGDPNHSTFWWDEESGAVTLVRENGTNTDILITAYMGAIFGKNDEILISFMDTLYKGVIGEDNWLAVETDATGCLERHGEQIYACGNPFLPESSAITTSQDGGESWTTVVEGFDVLNGLMTCDGEPWNEVEIRCNEPWLYLLEALELSPEEPMIVPQEESRMTMTETDASPESSDVEEVTVAENASGCSQQSGKGWPLLLMMTAIFSLGLRRKWVLCLTCLAFVFGCENNSDPANDRVIETVEIDTLSEDNTPDTIEAEEQRPPFHALVLLGEFAQEGNAIDEESAKGVIANVVFAHPDDLVPAFDDTIDFCSFRTVAADTDIGEPVGVSGGPVTLGGDGVTSPISFVPYDFGEEKGGFAYDHDLSDGTQSIFIADKTVEVNSEGTADAPSFSGEIPVPGSAPVLNPPAGPLQLDDEGNAVFMWEPEGSDEVFFEWDAFMTDGGAIQLRCSYPDKDGEGTVPAQFAKQFENTMFTMSISRMNKRSWFDGDDTFEVILSRRKVTFVFP